MCSSDLAEGNYTGTSLANVLQTKFNATMVGGSVPVTFTIAYDAVQNRISFSIEDTRVTPTGTMLVTIFDDESAQLGQWFNNPVPLPRSCNRIIGLRNTVTITESTPFYGMLDLHTTRNLYLVSSALASYDIISNFGLDTVIKKIPVRAGYNDILFDNASEGFDFLNVSRRSLRTVDFRLVDSYFNTIDLRGSHWSFNIIFQIQS